MSADKKSFEINLGNIGTKQYFLMYYSTMTSGTVQTNAARLTANGVDKTVNVNYHDLTGGSGHADGDLASKIKLIKVDEDGTTPLKDAVFTVTKPDGSTFELTTGADGSVVSNVLPQGNYKVKEKTAPKGYELGTDEYTLQVTSTGGAIQTITNKPIKTSVPVTKIWVGPKAGPITVHLLADGTDTGKTLTLNETGNWKGSFDGLRKYKTDGTEIVYTVKEDDIANYTVAITGDVTSGFTITNTNTEKVSVSGTKTWNDNNNQDGKRPASITVNLLKNGTKVDSKTVTPDVSGAWTYSFSGLDKYDATGTEITYTVSEDSVDGYTSTVTGTNITNSYIPETTVVKVAKTWVGPKAGSVTVHLLADGIDTGKTLTLDEAGNWTGTFSNLPKYKDGTAITYTVKEDDITNYTSTTTGDAITGFTITNTNTEKVDVPVKKEWVGPKAGPVTVHLLADGVDTGKTVTLSDTNSWTDTFSSLAKYKTDGTEIVYTVKEDDITNYTSATTGDATTGFTITNTNTEKVNVPVKKEWIGPKAGPVTVRLLADGVDTGKTTTLSDANSWTDTFSGLDKYKADGTAITYTVKEDEVSGYTSEITGDATTGFTITNTEVPHDTPKPKEDTPKKSGRKPAKKSGGVVPYTGDSNATGIAIALASAAVVLIGGGVYLRRRGKRE